MNENNENKELKLEELEQVTSGVSNTKFQKELVVSSKDKLL